MNCALFHDRLDALLDGALAALDEAEAEAHRTTCVRCDELYRLMQADETPGLVGPVAVGAPSGLTESILASTSGVPCALAHARLGDLVDEARHGLPAVRVRPTNHVADHETGQETDAIGLALVQAHVRNCRDCAALSSVLVRLRDDLPTFAELAPDASLVHHVLSRTIPTPVRGASVWERLRDAGRQCLARPRIAWEAGYVATLVVWLVFGASWSPLRATPAQALTLIQQGASDTQSAGVGAMAALNRGVSLLSERALGDERAPDDALGFLDGLSAYSRETVAVAPDLGEHWQRFTAAVLDRDLFGGVDALRSLSRDAGAMLRRLLFTNTDSGAPPDQRSTS